GAVRAVHDAPLAHSPGHVELKEARLSYRTLWRAAAHSALEVRLETGRKHQIRVQLAKVGHPILGDRRYGSRTAFTGAGIALFAERLTFSHPVTHEAITVAAPRELRPWSEPSPGHEP